MSCADPGPAALQLLALLGVKPPEVGFDIVNAHERGEMLLLGMALWINPYPTVDLTASTAAANP